MADQSISCLSCGIQIPLTRALRADIEVSLKRQFDETLQDRERELGANYKSRLDEYLQRARAEVRRQSRRSSPG